MADDLKDESKENINSHFVTSKEIIKYNIETLGKRHQKEYFSGLKTGFDEFDRLTLGLQSSELIIISGRPSVGKTSFALNIVENIAVNNNGTVAIFSLERSNISLMMKLLASCTLINQAKFLRGQLSNNDWMKCLNVSKKIANSQLYFCDEDMTGTEICEVSKILAKELETKGKKLDLIIIDYLELIHSNTKRGYAAENAKILKALAIDLKIPIIALVQISRAVQQRPMLSDLRDSGMEQYADVIAFIYREKNYIGIQDQAEIIIRKQKKGSLGTANLIYDKEIAKFFNKSEIKVE